MGAIEIICGIAMLIVSIAIIVLVAIQEAPKSGGISALTGGDSFFNKNKSRTRDALLAKATTVFAVVFFVATIIVYAVMARVVV